MENPGTYTKTDMGVTMVVIIMVSASVCSMQKLNLFYSSIVIASILLWFPMLITAYVICKKEKTKFAEYCLYFENMKMYFKVYGKLIIALKETYKIFPKHSTMAICVKKAMEEIEDSGEYVKALGYVDAVYHNTYLERLHSLLITGERQGGDSVYYNIDAIRYEEWKLSMNIFQKKKQSVKYMFYLMALLSFIISVYSLMAYQDKALIRALAQNSEYQLYTFLELELLFVLFFYIYSSLTNKKWIRSDE